MEEGSSPTTSESRRATVGAGWASRARPPPFKTETCFLTVLISPMSAPLLRRSPVSSFRSASSMGGAGSASSADAPPEMSASSRSPSSERLDKLLYLSCRLDAPLVGLGMGGENGLEILRTGVVAVFGNDEPAGDLLSEELPRGLRHRSRGLARRDHEHPLGREALPFDDDGAVFQIQRTPDGPLGVGRGQSGRPYLLQVLPHGTIVTGSGC